MINWYPHTPVDHRSTYRGVSTKWPMGLCQSIHNSYFHAMRAQNYMCIFGHYSSEYRSKIDWKSWYLAGSAHAWFRNFYLLRSESQVEKTPAAGVLSFALTPRSGGLGIDLSSQWSGLRHFLRSKYPWQCQGYFDLRSWLKKQYGMLRALHESVNFCTWFVEQKVS